MPKGDTVCQRTPSRAARRQALSSGRQRSPVQADRSDEISFSLPGVHQNVNQNFIGEMEGLAAGVPLVSSYSSEVVLS